MKRNGGYSLLEVLVIIGLISAISLVSYGSIVHFRYQADVDAAAGDLLATFRDAQAKSRDGQLPEGKSAADYTESGLPEYGVTLTVTDYTLRRFATLSDGTTEDIALETYPTAASLTYTPAAYAVRFDRVSGNPDTSGTVSINRSAITAAKVIGITADGIIAYE